MKLPLVSPNCYNSFMVFLFKNSLEKKKKKKKKEHDLSQTVI